MSTNSRRSLPAVAAILLVACFASLAATLPRSIFLTAVARAEAPLLSYSGSGPTQLLRRTRSLAPKALLAAEPIYVAGNPSCADLNASTDPAFANITSDYGFKIDGQPSDGRYYFTSAYGSLTGGAPQDPYNYVDIDMTSSSLGPLMEWAASLGIDALIVKGGPNANVYVYDPEAYTDFGLHPPINDNNDQYYGYSHVEFCYDYELAVSKTANATYDRTYQWTIDKSVTPDTINMFRGDSSTVQYTVAVTRTGSTDSNFAVGGTITINNNTPFNATITGITDQITGGLSPTPSCGVTLPYTLPAGQTLYCTYNQALTGKTNGVNTATVTTTGAVTGGTATAAFTFGDPTNIVNGTIDVDDTNNAGDRSGITDTTSYTYNRTFTCDADAGTKNNTATIVQTGQSDSASVTVNCYALNVSKTAAAGFNRTYNWTIDKSVDQSSLTLAVGQAYTVNYTVQVQGSYTDSGYAVSGNITVTNPAPVAATINGVTDVLTGGINASVNCGVSFPYTLAAGGTLNCTYTAALPDAAPRVNTATATLQNYSYAVNGTPTASGTTNFTGSANVVFGAGVEINKCIDVIDSLPGPLGTVCFSGTNTTYTRTFTYQRQIGPYLECGDYTVHNVASFVTNTTQATGRASRDVTIHIPCQVGCTLTQGYWKTHADSIYNSAPPYDDSWDIYRYMTDTTVPYTDFKAFFLSGQSYIDVMWTAPSGNVYYNLADQYIAATLNIESGASAPPEVLQAIEDAEAIFAAYTPAQIGALKGNDPLRKEIIRLAGILGSYNTGLIGPGHCDEDSTSRS